MGLLFFSDLSGEMGSSSLSSDQGLGGFDSIYC